MPDILPISGDTLQGNEIELSSPGISATAGAHAQQPPEWREEAAK
jgi:hypothetical protein